MAGKKRKTMETTNELQLTKEKSRILSNTLITFMVAMAFANIAAEMYMNMLPLYMKYLSADGSKLASSSPYPKLCPLFYRC